MKTTVNLPDDLLREAKQVACAERTTLRVLVVEGLRHVLRERRPANRLRLRRASFQGKGLRPGIEEGSWERIRDRAHEGGGA